MATAKTTDEVLQVNAPTRHQLIADAAISVLANEGARGLTHRAVDSEANLPEGSTSNLFRTRSALLEAVVDRHVQRELLAISAVHALESSKDLTVAKLAELLHAAIRALASSPGSALTACRYELYLEARRRSDLAAQLKRAREGFIVLMESLLDGAHLPVSRESATATLAFVEGLASDQLFHPESAVAASHLSKHLERFLKALA
jgi:DNA-binding transcriptional regulator YbjK